MDYATFCDKFEKIKDTVAMDGSGKLCTDISKLRNALKEMKEYTNLVGNFRPMDYVKWSEKHDMDEVTKTIGRALIFSKELQEHLNELSACFLSK